MHSFFVIIPVILTVVFLNSAGIGRTGTFIAMDYLYDQAKASEIVDVPQCTRPQKRKGQHGADSSNVINTTI